MKNITPLESNERTEGAFVYVFASWDATQTTIDDVREHYCAQFHPNGYATFVTPIESNDPKILKTRMRRYSSAD